MLTNFEILEIARHYKCPLNAVVQKNDLETQTPRFGNYVINLDSYPGNGTHWVAFIVQHEGAYYFDSFGQPPPMEVTTFLARFGPRPLARVEYNRTQIQHLDSELCGWYCLGLFLNDRANPKHSIFTSAKQYVAYYGKEPLFNGTLLKQFYKRRKPSLFVKQRLLVANVK